MLDLERKAVWHDDQKMTFFCIFKPPEGTSSSVERMCCVILSYHMSRCALEGHLCLVPIVDYMSKYTNRLGRENTSMVMDILDSYLISINWGGGASQRLTCILA